MPNWCANRLSVSGSSSDIEQVRMLFRGESHPAYQQAVAEGIHLFLAGCAGLLQPIGNVCYSPYPALTSRTGCETPENQAFTQWLEYLKSGAELTDEICSELHILWLASGISYRPWNTLNIEQQTVISALRKHKAYDWQVAFGTSGSEEMWNRLCRHDSKFYATVPFDMLQLIAPRLDVEINGYTGRLLKGVRDGFTDITERCGTKWPHAHEPEYRNESATTFDADFDTPWSPPAEKVLLALSERYRVTIKHWYAEAGGSFCGYAAYSAGVQTDAFCDSLEWSGDEDGFGCYEVTGPEWIIGNVANYGG